MDLINITISVPGGTSNHGDPNLLCTPTKWLDILTFFVANYFAHAVTVKALPGENSREFALIVLLAIAFPFSGVARGLEAILRHASFYRDANELQTAARAGAICIVVRDKDWVPGPRPNPFEGNRAYFRAVFDQGLSTNLVVWDERDNSEIKKKKNKFKYLTPNSRKVHGLSELPKGYRLALVPSNADVISNTNNKTDLKNFNISSSYSIPQIVVAIVQVLYASYTLYNTRGDQINRYGYAAFGLTVIPYIIMSFVNLIGNLLTPNYATLYLVSSPELEEAMLRNEGRIDGVVGKVNAVGWDDYATSNDLITGLSHLHHYSQTLFPECSPIKTVGGASYQEPRSLRGWSFLWWVFMVIFLGAVPYTVIGSLTHFEAGQSTQVQRVFTMFWLASGIFIGSTIPFYSVPLQEMVLTDIWEIYHKSTEVATTVAIEEGRKKRPPRTLEDFVVPRRRADPYGLRQEQYRLEDEAIEKARKARDKARDKRAGRTAGVIAGVSFGVSAGFRALVDDRFIFIGLSMFSAGALGGFIIVGQMLKDYGSCTLLS